MSVILTGLTTVAPVSLAPTAEGNVLGVNGYGRGFVVAGGTTAYPIGVTAPAAVSASVVTSPVLYYVAGVEVVRGGENYFAPPNVAINGVSSARALMIGDAVGSITITTSATTHANAPAVKISGNQATGAAATATVRGGVVAVNVQGGVDTYSVPPPITFSTALNVTAVRAAQARAVIQFTTAGGTVGPITSVVIEDPGVYEWGSADPPLTASAATGGVVLLPLLGGVVSAVSLSTGGSQYTAQPSVVLTPSSSLKEGGAAFAVADMQGTSSVQAVEILSNGSGYAGGVTVGFESENAAAVAVLQPRLAGRYLLGWRFVTSDGESGDLCPLVTLDCKDRARNIRWNLTGLSLTDGSPNRVTRLELWRTTADQAITLYRVASLTAAQVSALGPTFLFDEAMVDDELIDPERNTTLNGVESKYLELPILTDQGLPNAYRFGVPPSSMSVVTLFAERAWYAVDTSGAEPSTLYFSGVQEYESVPAENQLILQNAGHEADVITGLMPMGGVLYVGQRRSVVRVTVGDQPLLSSSAVPAVQRGLLNDRCWDQFEGLAYIVDSMGMYAFDGSSAEPLSEPVSTFWTDPVVDFAKSRWFFVRVNPRERVARFYFCQTGQSGDFPRSALCFSLTTKAWWLETYAVSASCGTRTQSGGQQSELLGSENRLLRTGVGLTDAGTAIPYAMRTGALPLNNEPSRGVRVLYTPTSGAHSLNARLYYNNSGTPRPNAIASDRGTGFVTTTGSTQATLDLSASRSPLGPASGLARFQLSGRMDDRSAGADRHVAIELAGDQTTDRPVLHRLDIEGVG